MDSINIHTGLDQFLLLDRITDFSDTDIMAEKSFSKDEKFLLIEAAAQLASYHVRLLMKCEKHAFLLKVERFNFLFSESGISGTVRLTASLENTTDRAYSYAILGNTGEKEVFQAHLIIATSDYTDEMKADQFKTYYQNSLSCLLKSTEKK